MNTASTYKNAVVCFNNFRDQYHLPLVYPAQPSHVVLFIAYCFETGLSPATIKTYIAGLSYHHKINMLHDPTVLFVVKKLLEGCHRSGIRTDSRAPITPSILTSICELLSSICYNVFEATMFKAAYLLTYYGLLRVSEVVHSSWQQFGRALQIQDITFEKSGQAVCITIRQSKTSQTGRPTFMRIPCEPDTNRCPVCALRNYVRIRPRVDGYLFLHANNKPLTRTQFSSVLSKCIASSPFRNCKILSHSFRIGRASELASKGVSQDAIMKVGRWHSQAVRSYIRNS